MKTEPRKVSKTQSAYLNIRTAQRDLDCALRHGFDSERTGCIGRLRMASEQIVSAIGKLERKAGEREVGK